MWIICYMVNGKIHADQKYDSIMCFYLSALWYCRLVPLASRSGAIRLAFFICPEGATRSKVSSFSRNNSETKTPFIPLGTLNSWSNNGLLRYFDG